MSKTTDISIASALAAGNSPDVILLGWAGKALPAPLRGFHRDTLAALRAVRGLVRDDSIGTAAKLDFARRLEQLANGNRAIDVTQEWQSMVCASPAIAAMTAGLLQAAQRELSFAQRAEPALFAGWSDFYSHARFSIVPVGRALLDGAGVPSAAANEAMDALMTAVALIATLQEAPQRYRQSSVVSLPMQWLVREGLDSKSLGQSRCPKQLRQVFERGADRGYELLAIAGPARNLKGIGGHAAAVNLLAHRLLHRLRRRDPLARPIALGLFDRLALRLANIRQFSQ